MNGERATAARGRPLVSSVQHLEAVAVELFDRDGYQATTIQDVARAAGVSRSTVFRYVNNKIQLLWLFAADYEAELLAGLAEPPQERTVFQVIEDAMVRCATLQVDRVDLLRRKLRIIAANEEQMLALRGWTADTAALIESHLATAVPARAGEPWMVGVGYSYTAASGVALVRWALAEETDAVLPETIAAALAPLTGAYEQAFSLSEAR